MSAYLFAPLRTNVLILGLDRAPQGTTVARSDTIVLATFLPSRPYVGLLSIPRDLWVVLPDGSSNRINTAHYFAEAAAPGSGPEAARATVQSNFGVDVHHTIRLQFSALTDVVDALGGVTVELEQGTALYPAGRHHLDGEQALAFVRDREASDDFGRMARGQFFARALLRRVIHPAVWPRLPAAAAALATAVETDVPLWQWPRLALCLLRVGPEGLDGRVLDRSMARGFTTADGAQVLAPN
jgi:LCP family protein required for cell wall assembly